MSFFKFEDWLSIQLSDFLEAGDDPNRERSVNYLEYRFSPSLCSGLAEQAERIITGLRNSTSSIEDLAPQSGLVEVIVDGPYYSVSVRFRRYLNGTFGIGASAGPIFDAVHSTFRSVRECSRSMQPTLRKHDF